MQLALQSQERAELRITLGDERGVSAAAAAKGYEVGAEFVLRAGQLLREIFAEASLRVSRRGPLTGWKVFICSLARYR